VTVAIGEPEEQEQRRIRRDSDALLATVDEIRQLEQAKRTHRMSAPEFHDAAERITQKSRRVFEIAGDEEETGNDLSETKPETTNDVAP
jgi:hypothetical protein